MGKELFKNIPSKVEDLVKGVRNGRIGLPDLQRPFVWKDNKVRELFDSMLKGYPIGYIMLWESPADYESKKSTIGDNSKTYEEPKELGEDGYRKACEEHALPKNFEGMEYMAFLSQRRILMAQTVRKAYQRLCE